MRVYNFILPILILCFMGCAVKIPDPTPDDFQELEEAMDFFRDQLKNDMHPVISDYLDEVLDDPDSFSLQRFAYTLTNYRQSVPYEKKRYLFGGQTETYYREVRVPAYHIKMHFRSRIPQGGLMLQEMSFYLFQDGKLVLSNGE